MHRFAGYPSNKEQMPMTGADLSSLLPALLPRLWKLALRTTSNHHDAKTLVQRACEHALERAHHLQSDTVTGRTGSRLSHPEGIGIGWIELPQRLRRCCSARWVSQGSRR